MKKELTKVKRVIDDSSLRKMGLVELHEKETYKIIGGGSLMNFIAHAWQMFKKIFMSKPNFPNKGVLW